MSKRLLSLAVAGSMLLGAGLASAGVPDPAFCSSSSASGTVLIVPTGAEASLAALGLTVTVTVADNTGTAIAGYPFQDIYLDDSGTAEIVLCQGGSVADGNTDAAGQTTISGAISGGGWTQSGLQVYLAGVPIGSALGINANSADLNADLGVDLADLSQFSADYGDPDYEFRADLSFDNLINLADLGAFSRNYLTGCP